MNNAQTNQQQYKKMTETPVQRLVLSMSIPTVISQLITVIYNTADTWFVSKIDTSASAAVGIVFSIMAIIQAFGFGISMGTGSIISKSLGEKNDEKAETIAVSGVFAAGLIGVVVGVLGLVFLEPLMRLLGSSDTILPYSCDYARYIFLSAPMMSASFVLGNTIRSEGKATLSMIGLAAGGVLNIFLDPVLIFVLDMGIKGAAISTALSQLLGFIILVYFYLSGKTLIKLKPSKISKKPRTYYEIITTGIPTVFRQSMGSIAAALLNRKAMVYGDCAVAAISIATKVYVLIRNIILGIGQGFMPVAGYNFGARKLRRTRQSFGFATLMGTAVCLVSNALIYNYRTQIILWFRNDPEVIDIGSQALWYFTFALPLLAYSTYVNQLYQCLGFKIRATILACCRQGIFFIPILFISTKLKGIAGIECTQAFADICTFLVSVPLQIYFFRHELNDKGSLANDEK